MNDHLFSLSLFTTPWESAKYALECGSANAESCTLEGERAGETQSHGRIYVHLQRRRRAAAIHVRIAICRHRLPPLLRFAGFRIPKRRSMQRGAPVWLGKRSHILPRGWVKKYCLLFAPLRLNYFVYMIHFILCVLCTLTLNASWNSDNSYYAEVAVMSASGRPSVKINV